MRRSHVLWVLLTAVGIAGRAAAEPSSGSPTARLVYARGPGAEACPEESELRTAIAARLGYVPFREDAARTIRATLAREKGVLRASVEVDSGGKAKGERRMESSANDCGELASAMTLAISIAIDPLTLVRVPSPAAPLAAPREEPPSPPPPPAADRPPEHAVTKQAPAEPIVPQVSVGTFAAFGQTPAPAFGAAFAGGARYRAVSLELEGRASLPSSTDGPSGGSVRATLLSASLVPCLHAWAVFACGLASAGALQGSGSGVTLPGKDSTALFGLGARIGGELPIYRFVSARLHADLESLFPRTTLRLDQQDVWTTPLFAGAVGLDAVAVFR